VSAQNHPSECVFRHLDAKGLRVCPTALEALAKQLAGQQIQRQHSAFTIRLCAFRLCRGLSCSLQAPES
jgi:hypothetical protein